MVENPEMLIRHGAQESNITIATSQRVLAKDLHFDHCKVQLIQKLVPTDHAQR